MEALANEPLLLTLHEVFREKKKKTDTVTLLYVARVDLINVLSASGAVAQQVTLSPAPGDASAAVATAASLPCLQLSIAAEDALREAAKSLIANILEIQFEGTAAPMLPSRSLPFASVARTGL